MLTLWYLSAVDVNAEATIALGFCHMILERMEEMREIRSGMKRDQGRMALVTMWVLGVTTVYSIRARAICSTIECQRTGLRIMW